MNFTLTQLREQGTIQYTNEHNLDAEEINVEVEESQISTWDNPFKVWVNGELHKSYKTFKGLHDYITKLVADNDLKLSA